MSSDKRSKLVKMVVRNIGCIGDEGVEIALDNVVCLVGKNNAGKSTILRAYELAKGAVSFDGSKDRCQHATDDVASEVILEIHIPESIGNIDSMWKIPRDGLLIVKSRWQWSAPDFQKIRSTWNPRANDGKGDWDPDKNAAGLDNVFSSRLPRPLRIGSLDDAAKTEEMLLTLALTPLLAKLENERKNSDSVLSKAIDSITQSINSLSQSHEHQFNEIAGKVSSGFQQVFPTLGVILNIAAAPLSPKLDDLVKRGSGLRVSDGNINTSLGQQGTGARRALFWAMLQVHNEISREKEIRDEYRKGVEKSVADEEKKLKAEEKKAKKNETLIAEFEKSLSELTAIHASFMEGAPIPESPEDPALPGYLLLIDEPENALHPLAARAAQRHLYKLAESADWQVMMTTHSPYFINPFEDHTTIVRLERTASNVDASIVPKTYLSDSIEFSGDDKQRLQALQHIDPSFAEVFFGSYPVLVEGDTEHATFIASIIEKQNNLMDQITVIRARGKAILVPLIKVLTHFKINFGIIHDCDPPFKSNGDKNGMWTENEKIYNAICDARKSGITVRHRVSIPDFERFLGGDEESKDKPLNAYMRVVEDATLSQQVQTLLSDLFSSENHEPFEDFDYSSESYLSLLNKKINEWAIANSLADHIRFKGKESV